MNDRATDNMIEFGTEERLFDIDDDNNADDSIGSIDDSARTETNHSGAHDEAPESLTYIAHFISPVTENPVKGFFEYESVYRASSKQNRQDARIRMLEIYGKDAVGWTIDTVKIKKKNDPLCGDQIELDFREPKKPRKRRKSKKYL